MKLYRLRRDGISTNVVSFQTKLGWMAVATRENTVHALTFAHADADSAIAAVESEFSDSVRLNDDASPNSTQLSPKMDKWLERLVQMLRAYASGKPTDFRDIKIHTDEMTDFGRRTIIACRKIPYGKTTTYGELAATAGSPAAARAVGRCMATNRIPIIVPCHRVLTSGKGLGGFSAPGGTETKRRLLDMEGV